MREPRLVQLDNADVTSEAVRANANADGRSPDNMSDNTVAQLAPLVRQRDEELLELGDAPVRLVELGLEVREHLLRVWESDLPRNPVGISHDRLLQRIDGVVEFTDASLDGRLIVVESRSSHHDDLALRAMG